MIYAVGLFQDTAGIPAGQTVLSMGLAASQGKRDSAYVRLACAWHKNMELREEDKPVLERKPIRQPLRILLSSVSWNTADKLH